MLQTAPYQNLVG